MSSQNVKIWQQADAVCFDFDSTVITGEGIDDLATFCGVGEEVKDWTQRAMSDGISFRDALTARLNILQPTKEKLKSFLKMNPSELTPGIKELIEKLQELGKHIYFVSGGFYSIIKPIADELNITGENIFSNRILFNDKGSFEGFDETQPTSSSGGKIVVVETLRKKYEYKLIVTIGDGMTDLETYPPADLFIGFGGNRVRENVKKNSPWFVTDFKELLDAL